jgi:hypothetical protein
MGRETSWPAARLVVIIAIWMSLMSSRSFPTSSLLSAMIPPGMVPRIW